MKTLTFTKAELDQMTPEQFTNVVLKAHKISATAVVRRKDGTIKYDDPAMAGNYGEEYLNDGSARV